MTRLRRIELGAALAGMLLASAVAVAAGVEFTVENGTDSVRTDVVGVSLPVARGLLKGELPQSVRMNDRDHAVQATPITYWPDGSARRVMLRFPVELAPGVRVAALYPGGSASPPPSAFERQGPRQGIFRSGSFDVRIDGCRIRLCAPRTDRVLAEIEPHGPALAGAGTATWTVLEEGPHFLWLRVSQTGGNACREFDVRIDSRSLLRFTHRLQSRLGKNEWTPDFGVDVRVPEGTPSPPRSLGGAVTFGNRDGQVAFAENDDLCVGCTLADGRQLALAPPLALRQRRGTLGVDPLEDGASGVRIRLSRLEPVERENDRLMIQDGQWRISELLVCPGTVSDLAQRMDRPVRAFADCKAYDAVYRTGPPLAVRHPVLRELAETAILYMHRLSIDGDDWGNMTFYDPRTDRAQINSFVRFNHCAYVWHDYFRTGDARLWRIARDWSENYRNLSVYWGSEKKHYGGSRRGRAYRAEKGLGAGPGTYMVRFDYALGFVTKGYHNFWLAYEETGDPRFKEAAEAQAAYSMENVHCDRGEMRNVGMIADFAKMYEYTGRTEYLTHAKRLWQEFQSKQMPDLMFTQNCKPATGNDLYIPNDDFGYKHPFYKPYITQYATNALPYLYRFCPEDARLRRTIAACNRWMAGAQDTAGRWGYPAPRTAGGQFSPEYCHGMMLAYELDPDVELLDATGRSLRSMVRLFERHKLIPTGVMAWEQAQKQTELLKTYRLATDRDREKDYTHGQIAFSCSPDNTVYLMATLRDYLEHRPEASLFAPDPVTDQLLALPTTADGMEANLHHPWAKAAVAHRVTEEGMCVRLLASPIFPCLPLRSQWRWDDGRTAAGLTAERAFGGKGERTAVLAMARGDMSIERRITFRTPAGPADFGWERWPAGIRIQAENIAGQGGCKAPVRILDDRCGADGGALAYWDDKGHWLEYRFAVPRTGSWFLLVKYACPRDATRTVAVDGADVGVLHLPGSGGYTTQTRDDYSVVILATAEGKPKALPLNAGEHVLRFTNADGRGCNLDCMQWFRNDRAQ